MHNENFTKFVQSCCSDAVTKDEEYMELQIKLVQAEKNGNIEAQEEYNSRMEVRAEEVCFIAGFNAAMQIMLNIRN